MSGTPSNDVIFDRMQRFGEQLELHRSEAREASLRTEAKLDEIARFAPRVVVLEERTDALDATVNGEHDEPGMKGRLDRAEQKLAFGVWFASTVAILLLGLIFEWVKRAFGVATH